MSVEVSCVGIEGGEVEGDSLQLARERVEDMHLGQGGWTLRSLRPREWEWRGRLPRALKASGMRPMRP